MPTRVFIHGHLALWPGRAAPPDRFELGDAFNNLLQDSGEVVWDEHQGSGWSVELLLYDDADIGGWVQRLDAFLRRWGAPAGTSILSL